MLERKEEATVLDLKKVIITHGAGDVIREEGLLYLCVSLGKVLNLSVP